VPPMQQLHIDAALSEFGYGVLQDSSEHVAGGFFPFTEVDHLSDKYHVLPREPFMRGDATKHASLQEAPTFEFELSTDNYNVELFRRGADVDNFKLLNADPIARRLMEEGATRIVVDNLLLQHEVAWAGDFFTTGKWGTDLTGVNAAPGAGQFLRWNDANSDPEKDIDDAKLVIKLNGGLWPNALLVGPQVWMALKRHPKFLNRIVPTSRENITPQIVAALLGLDRIVVAGAAVATNVTGQASSFGFVHGKHALLAYVGKSGQGELMPSAGRIFTWRGLNPGALQSRILTVERIPMPLKKGTRYEAAMAYDNKVTGSQLAVFFNTAVV
jgi:hypothetical protein